MFEIRYTAIATFASRLPLTQHNWTIVDRVDNVPPGGRVLAQASSGWSYVVGYVLNLASTFAGSGGTLPPFTTSLHGCPDGGNDANTLSDGVSSRGNDNSVLHRNNRGSSNAKLRGGLSLQWFNTSTGLPIGSSVSVACQNGAIPVTTPSVPTDVAFTISAV